MASNQSLLFMRPVLQSYETKFEQLQIFQSAFALTTFTNGSLNEHDFLVALHTF